jgi:hypothetical protein
MSVERAAALFYSYGVEFTITRPSVSAADRDPQLSEIAWENALRAILVGRKPGKPPAV